MPHLLFVVSGPAASGKTTIVTKVLERLPEFKRLVTTTTRPPRPGEEAGIDYHFVSKNNFRLLIQSGAFVEHAEYNNELYGLTKVELTAKLSVAPCLAILETNGAKAIRASGIPHCSIFIRPPNIEDLQERIQTRGGDSTKNMKNRLEIAKRELECADQYDFQIYNNCLSVALDEVCAIISQKLISDCPSLQIKKTTESV